MKVGDEVRLSSEGKDKYTNDLSNPHNWNGVIRHIKNVKPNTIYFVSWFNGSVNSYNNSELELVSDDNESNTLNNFKVGDKVKYKDGKAIYTITQIDGDNIKTFYKDNFYVIKAHKLELYNKETEELNGLPKYWVVKTNTTNPLWKDFIKYVEEKFGYSIRNSYDYYGFVGSPTFKGFDCSNKLELFRNNPTLITLEQWWGVINKHNEIKDFTLSTPIKPTDNLGTITTDYHGNFLHTNYGTMKAVNKLNDIRSEKFFNNEKNLVAIETLNDTLQSGIKLMEDSIKELMDSKDKFEKLIHKLDTAANESDVSLLKSMIAQIDEVKFFVKQLEETKIEKYRQANESVFSIKDFLSSKK